MEDNTVFLGSYPLQKDMRIRLPKQILSNLPSEVGDVFNVYFNPATKEITLRHANTDDDRRPQNEIK